MHRSLALNLKYEMIKQRIMFFVYLFIGTLINNSIRPTHLIKNYAECWFKYVSYKRILIYLRCLYKCKFVNVFYLLS